MTITFPNWVTVTKCETASTTRIIPTPHGIVRVELTVSARPFYAFRSLSALKLDDMTRAELGTAHAEATVTRTLAHKAYEVSLRNREVDGDTYAAYHLLLDVNRVRERIYNEIITRIVSGVSA